MNWVNECHKGEGGKSVCVCVCVGGGGSFFLLLFENGYRQSCLYKNGNMITPKEEQCCLFRVDVTGLKMPPQYINGVNGIKMSE